MSKNEVTENKSHSQVKREERKKEVAQARRTAKINQIIGWLVILVLAGLVAWGVVALVMFQLDKVTPNSNYSDGLDANGYIEGVRALDKVELPFYKGIEVPYEEIEYTDESIDADIESLLADAKEKSTDESLKVKDGDTVDIGYVGSIDGVEFEGGTSESYDLEIGSGSFIPGFEEQLIGHDNMTSFDINVTFPEDYSSADLAGKDAVFAITINGIYATPEFTDEYVAENYPEKGSTVAEYREAVRAEKEKSTMTDWLVDYLKNLTTVKSYPSKYIKILKGIKKYDDQQSYEYMNAMYEQYMGSAAYSSFEDYVGVSSEAEYDKSLKETVQDNCKESLIFQAILEEEGVTADADYYRNYLSTEKPDEADYDTQVTTSGEPYVLQQAIRQKALDIVVDSAVVKK